MKRPPRLDSTRIVVFVRSFEMGGAERQAVQAARFLQAAGASVLVWSFTDGRPVRTILERAGLPFRIQSPGIAGSVWERFKMLSRFVKDLRAWRPDILLPFTDLPNKVCGAVWPLTGARGCIWNQRDEGREITGRPLERIALRITPFFIANSEIGRVFLNRQFSIPRERIVIVPNGVRIADAEISGEEWRARLGLNSSVFVATMIANLHHYKDHETLVHAWSQVIAEHPDSVLLLVGKPGPTSGLIEELVQQLEIESSVRFLGYIDDIPGILSMTDLAVFSSTLEGCPNGILEPMAAGRAVVATDIIGAREALGADYPFLVPEKDPDACAQAILRLIGDDGLQDKLGARNRERIRREFDPDRVYQRLGRIISGALG